MSLRSLLFLLIAVAFLLGWIARPFFYAGTKVAAQPSVVFVGSHGDLPGQFQQPRGIAVLPDRSFVVVDRAARGQHFSAEGKPLALWNFKDHALGNPKGICALPDGNILVCDTHYGRVLKMTPSGEILATWGEPGKDPAHFIHPLAAAVDAARGWAYVVEYGAYNDRVQKFNLSGKWLLAFGTCGTEPGQMQRPSGVAVGNEGTVFVADACNHRIQAFDPDGKFLRTFGSEGRAPGEMMYPYDIAVGSDGLLYVAEFANHRVTVFDQGGAFRFCFGSPGDGPDQFDSPWSLCTDAHGHLLVSDTRNHRVKIFELAQLALAGNTPHTP